MAQNISSLTYNAISPNTNKGIATLILDPAIDLVWNVKLLGSVQGASQNVIPKFISVDNIKGAVGISTKLGFYQYQTPPFQRETTFLIPDGIQDTTFTFELGAITPVTVYISEDKIADNMNNQLLIQQTAAKTLVYEYRTVTATGNQQLTDGNTQIQFVPLVAPIQYNLLDVAGADVQNGFLSYIQNNGNFPVTVLPFGTQTINGSLNPNSPGFNAGAPMILQPGDGGILSSDGTNWFFQGRLSYTSPQFAILPTTVNIANHGLGKVPDEMFGYLYCAVANNGWNVGDLAYEGAVALDGGNANAFGVANLSATQLTFLIGSTVAAFPARLLNKATAADIVITNAQWKVVYKLKALWF